MMPSTVRYLCNYADFPTHKSIRSKYEECEVGESISLFMLKFHYLCQRPKMYGMR